MGRGTPEAAPRIPIVGLESDDAQGRHRLKRATETMDRWARDVHGNTKAARAMRDETLAQAPLHRFLALFGGGGTELIDVPQELLTLVLGCAEDRAQIFVEAVDLDDASAHPLIRLDAYIDRLTTAEATLPPGDIAQRRAEAALREHGWQDVQPYLWGGHRFLCLTRAAARPSPDDRDAYVVETGRRVAEDTIAAVRGPTAIEAVYDLVFDPPVRVPVIVHASARIDGRAHALQVEI